MSRIGGNLVEISAAASTVIGAPNAEAVLLPVNERPASSRIDFGDAGVTDVVPRRHGIGR
ncbi:hypothetical protein KXX57_005607 [Aspergillus fumigatus]|nr:hypothetical protein KXX57_005607 [Aspergillus fumigatus]